MKYIYTNTGTKKLVMIAKDKDNVRLASWADVASYSKEKDFKDFATLNKIKNIDAESMDKLG